MTKKILLASIIIMFLYTLLTADLANIYKKAEIVLIPDSEFGMNTEWDVLFSRPDECIAFLPDGSFFRSARRSHKIYKFNEKGDLLSEFGQQGQGPGDLTNPSDLSILDGKYLVVREFGLSRRISIFDLESKFVKLIKADSNVLSCVSLKENKVAILTGNLAPEGGDKILTLINKIYIKDISNNEEVNVVSFEQKVPRVMNMPTFYGSVHISKIDDDKLLVGFSEIPNIFIYSINGKELYSFKVNLERKKVKNDDIDSFIDRAIKSEKREGLRERMRQYFKQSRDNMVFPEQLPYYYKIAVDSENNILIFLNNWIDDSEVRFQVYSKNGQYICETKINSGNFIPVYPTNFYKQFFYTTLINKIDDTSIIFTRIKLE